MPLNVLLIAPYFGGSHRAWGEGYVRHSRHRIACLTLPSRFWKWRMQGAAVTLAERARAQPRPDVLLVTDMLDLPTFLGLTRAALADVPVALYCHENQLTYPVPPGERRDLTYAMINWRSMLAADRIFFNSRFHRGDWFAALPNLLKHFPDYVHLDRIPAVRAKAQVLPVGCDLARLEQGSKPQESPPLILWNQRWEYDKDPRTFFQALDALVADGIDFRVALAGSNVRQQPEEFEAARARLGERVVHYGRADAATYRQLLRAADVVVSTAIHEFFGVAVVEALYCRCFPVLPHRLAYPELFPGQYHGRCLYRGFDALVDRLTWALTHPAERRRVGVALSEAVARFDWSQQAPAYDAALASLVHQKSDL